MISFDVTKIRINVKEGDIVLESSDAVVNAANDRFWMGSGVAGAIKSAGGEIIEREAMKKGPVNAGEAVFTGAGNLRAKYIIHAAVMGQDLKTGDDVIKKATVNSLKIADKLKCKSVSFPAFGTGVGGFPVRECAKIMCESAKDMCGKMISIKEINFVLFGKEAFLVFCDVFTEILG